MSLYKLPDEVLLIIFNYCDEHDLMQLKRVCKRFCRIALESESNHLLITSQMSKKFCQRCQPLLLSYKKKFYIHNNWKWGRYESKIIYPKPVSNRRCLYHNCIQMTTDLILFVSDFNLCAFNRTKNGLVSNDNVIVAKCSSDVLDIFVPRNDIILTHHSNGSIRQWTIELLDGKKYFNEKLLIRPSCSNCPFIDCYFVDVTLQSIVTGAYTDKIKLWKYIPEENVIMDKYTIPDLNLNRTLDPYVHFITFDPTGTKFAAGISYEENRAGRCIIYDINKCCTEHIEAKDLNLNLFTLRQILWRKPNDILYLTKNDVIKIDARTHKVVQKWKIPVIKFKHSIPRSVNDFEKFKCMSTDNQYAIMTGTSYGKVILWDQRQSDYIQVYDKKYVGNVNCLQFDSSRMYIAAEWGIHEFDFTKI